MMFRFVLVNHVRGGGNFQYLQRHVTRHQGNVTKLNTSQKFEKEVFGMNYCTPFFFWIKGGAAAFCASLCMRRRRAPRVCASLV
jgi:hypothetical protein